jgi:hypothetical protein
MAIDWDAFSLPCLRAPRILQTRNHREFRTQSHTQADRAQLGHLRDGGPALAAVDWCAQLPPVAVEDLVVALHMMKFAGAMIRSLGWGPYFFCWAVQEKVVDDRLVDVSLIANHTLDLLRTSCDLRFTQPGAGQSLVYSKPFITPKLTNRICRVKLHLRNRTRQPQAARLDIVSLRFSFAQDKSPGLTRRRACPGGRERAGGGSGR